MESDGSICKHDTWCPDHWSLAALVCPFPWPRAQGGCWALPPSLPGEPKSHWLYPPGVLSLGHMHHSHGPAAWELVSLLSTGRLSPSRPFGHTGTWSSAWLEVWSAWLSLFACWCGLSSSQRGWRDALRLAAAVGCVSGLGWDIPSPSLASPGPQQGSAAGEGGSVPASGTAGQVNGGCPAPCPLWEDVSLGGLF